MHNENILEILKQYDVALPRYTSYPTVPYWETESITPKVWTDSIVQTFELENGEISIYIHLPFCENLCTFCACNKRITKNHTVETPYLNSVLKEWHIYRTLLPSEPKIKEIHLGGGTPTFFSPENLSLLIEGILSDAEIANDHEFSIEVHPNHTSEEHLKVLALLGFNRISLGVQDFDPNVQFIINRIQSFETTLEVIQWARKHNYKSINIDLIYGLPKQTLSSIKQTIEYVKQLKPDRIAFYSYAHVPWKSKVQRRYSDEDLPKAEQKWKMYQLGRNMLIELGFKPIGMDHFALPDDKLFVAAEMGELHRNFMGYTTTKSKLIIGLGCSSIGDAWNAFAQNEKEVEEYQNKINQGILPLVNGHHLNKEDIIIRTHILSLMCTGRTLLNPSDFEPEMFLIVLEKLQALQDDGLIMFSDNTIQVLEKGELFIRNISSALDARLWRNTIKGNVFSKSI